MSIRVTMCPVIDMEEIECELDIHRDQFNFYQRDDYKEGYIWIGTDEDEMSSRHQEIADYLDMVKEHGEEWVIEGYTDGLENDILLIEKLREMGFDDGALIYVWN